MSPEPVALPLGAVTPAHAVGVGGKAYNCARLLQAGFPVPDGFVIAPSAALPSLDELAPFLRDFAPDALFAVRSSGADEDGGSQSFAGLHLTLLNVQRQDLPAAIASCRASADAESVKAYSTALGFSAGGGLAVLVQQMVQPDVSGVAFTVDPVGRRPGSMVVNASWGLGEAVVSGRVDPDEFELSRADGSVLRTRLGTKAEYLAPLAGGSEWRATPSERQSMPCLDPEQLAALARLLRQVEAFLEAPQDVEWCLSGGAWTVVQSRPITTMPVVGVDREWSRANALEGLPDLPKPQVGQAIVTMVDRAMRQLFPESWAPEAQLGPIATTIYGRPYYNLSQVRHMSRRTGTPTQQTIQQFGGVTRPEDFEGSRRLRSYLRLAWALLKILRLRFTAGRSLERSLAAVRGRLAFLRIGVPAQLSDAELWQKVSMPDDIAGLMGGAPATSGVLWELLKVPCRRAAHAMDRLLHAHLAAAPKTNNTLQGLALIELAQVARADPAARTYFQEAQGRYQDYRDYRDALSGTAFLGRFDDFLQEYGHCGNYEKDWSLPRYAEDQTPLLHAVGLHVLSGEALDTTALLQRQKQELADAWRDFEASLGPRRSFVLRPFVRAALSGEAWSRHLREAGRFENARMVALGRHWHLALARRMVERGWIDHEDDYFYLLLAEVKQALDSTEGAQQCRAIVASRKQEHARWLALELPTVLRDSEVTMLREPAPTAPRPATDGLTGLCVSRGVATGHVVVIPSASEFHKMKPGAIIVAPATDPSWTPLLTLASGVITEIGGTLSHAATLARELGIPALSNVIDATRALRDGDYVTLDAVEGTVRRSP